MGALSHAALALAKHGQGSRLPHLRVHAQGSVALDEGFHDTAAGDRGRGHEHLVPLHRVQEGPEGPHHLRGRTRVKTPGRSGGNQGRAEAPLTLLAGQGGEGVLLLGGCSSSSSSCCSSSSSLTACL